MVHTTSEVKFYLNGIQINGSLISGSYGSLINNSHQPLRVGSYRQYSGAIVAFFEGRMDEFRLWDRPLTTVEIQARMNHSLVGNESGLIAYFDMENNAVGAGLTVPNGASSTGTTNNGTALGSGTTPFFLDNTTTFDSLDLGPDSISAAIGITLDANNSGTTYLWQDGTTDTTLTTTTTGWYWVDAIIGSCTFRDSIYFTLLPLGIDGCPDYPCGDYGERRLVCSTSGNRLCVSASEVLDLMSQGASCGPCEEPEDESPSNSVKTYPNPFRNSLTISMGENFYRIRLIDMQSGLIKEEISDQSGLQFQFDMAHLPKGFWILEVLFPNGNIVRKKVIKI